MHKGDETKQFILDEAVQLASVNGLHGLTIGGLAQQVHLSKGGICAHFPSKEALQLAVVHHAARIFTSAVVVPALAAPAGQARLVALSEAWFAYIQKPIFLGGCFFTNSVLEVDDRENPDVRSAVREHYQHFLTFIQREMHSAVQQRQLPSTAPSDQSAFAFLTILSGVLIWRGLGQQEEGIKKARYAFHQLLHSS
ncbi:MAG: TetR/AcrR family transcriptional regulator [Ktedonobacterales bacterium]|nr:TetR/AcrR family transcriptional regulator [Ktedonobacterales bacterium]